MVPFVPYPEMAETALELCEPFEKPVGLEIGDLEEDLQGHVWWPQEEWGLLSAAPGELGC